MDGVADRDQCVRSYMRVREYSETLAAPLSVEDQCIQSMPDASPTKWHLAHTTWFFEALVLKPHVTGYVCFGPAFHYLFNSYYEVLGDRHPRHVRGMLTRPDHEEILAYRRHVDHRIADLLVDCSSELWPTLHAHVTLGIQHEQQHQELMLTDILHAFSCNPTLPAYRMPCHKDNAVAGRSLVVNDEYRLDRQASRWTPIAGGIFTVGHDGESFAFDNEKPQHPVILQPFEMETHLVTCGAYLQFIEDDGHQRPEFWLSDGWGLAQSQQWNHPLYWIPPGDFRAPSLQWQIFSLDGVVLLPMNMPVMNLSFHEAYAFAAWAGARLPTEFEWEVACARHDIQQRNDHAWQWTRSSYDPYPGFRPMQGLASEYNGKFMVGQQVLRGGSHATPAGHTRLTYRNYFPPAARWQFAGIRLARG